MTARKIFIAILFSLVLLSRNAYADLWGADIPLLIEIVANTFEQLSKLSDVIGKGQETIDILNDINRGIRDAADIIRTSNNTLEPGLLSDLDTVQKLMTAVENIYGRIPKTQNSKVQETTDTSIAESFHLHNEAFRYAERVDPEGTKIKEQIPSANPLGAQKLTAQALTVLIHISNQILRVNSAMLKIQTQSLALQNRASKLNSEQFKLQYDGLSRAFRDTKPNFKLPTLSH